MYYLHGLFFLHTFVNMKLRKNIKTIGVMYLAMLGIVLSATPNKKSPPNNTQLLTKVDSLADMYKDSVVAAKKEIFERDSLFDLAVSIIKKYEGWHTAKNYPYVGYGHKLLKNDTFNHNISEEFATELLKKDLRQKCSVFREFGKDSLILGVLAYNIGEYKIKGGYGYKESMLAKKLRSGDRDVREEYVSHCRWKGRAIPSIKKRRIEEFNKLYQK